MRKSILSLISLMLMIFGFCAVALAEQPPVTLEEAIAGANAELQSQFGLTDYFININKNGKAINPNRWKDKDRVLFAYGEPYGDTKMTDDGIRYRYIGETVDGEDFTNPHFPHDVWAGGKLEDRNWIVTPWKIDTIINKYNIWSNKFDGNTMYLPSIQAGLKHFYSDVLQGESSAYWNNWHEYVHILQPPTEFAWGLGRMWHQKSDGSLWYISVPLVPVIDAVVPEINLKVSAMDSGVIGKAKVGEVYTATVDYKNESTETVTVPVGAWNGNWQAILLDSPDSNEKVEQITLEPGEIKTKYFKYSAQSTKSMLVAKIDTPPLDNIYQETTEIDNTMTIEVPSEEPPLPPPGPSTGSLSLTAINQEGYKKLGPVINRPANTAKWTDYITAKLTAPKPSVPSSVNPIKGDRVVNGSISLTSYWVSQATITYPKKNPEFTFGTPYPPYGTITKNMNLNGYTANLTFEENWAMDGANIYSHIEQCLMATTSKYYPISCSYTLKYEYSWEEEEWIRTENGGYWASCGTFSKTESVNGSASSNLLVNGTGVDSRAQ